MIAKYRPSRFGRLAGRTALLLTLGLIGATRETKAEAAGSSPPKLTPLPAKAVSSPASTTQAPPPGWFLNGSHPNSYIVGLDSSQIHVAPVSSYIKSNEPEIPGFGGMMQSFEAKDYRGKRVRFSAWIRTADVSKSANIWMRVDGPQGPIKFDNIDNRAPHGTKNWQPFAAVLDIPDEAMGIYIGFFVAGTGQAWFNDPKFEVVDTNVHETNTHVNRGEKRQMPLTPQNLSFETDLP